MEALHAIGIDSREIHSVLVFCVFWFLSNVARSKITQLLEQTGFDRVWTSPIATEKKTGKKNNLKESYTPSQWIGLLAKISVLLIATSIILKYYDFNDFRVLIKNLLIQSWAIILTTIVTILLSRLFTLHAVFIFKSEAFQSRFEKAFSISGTLKEDLYNIIPNVMMATIYFLMLCLELLAIMQSYDLTVATQALIMLWSLVIKLVSVLFISLIGWYGLNAWQQRAHKFR